MYSLELIDLSKNAWFPNQAIAICNKDYGNSKSLKAIGVREYTFSNVFDNVISKNIKYINAQIQTKVNNVDFHNCISLYIDKLNLESVKNVMSSLPVFLYGSETPSPNSTGHSVLSQEAKKLFELQLVDKGDLEIIDTAYDIEINSAYWTACLENNPFSVGDFLDWLKSNNKSFAKKIMDKNVNITFWRWVKENVSELHYSFIPKNLPVCVKDMNELYPITCAIYLSNEYCKEGGIEGIVKQYKKDSLFISPLYVNKKDSYTSWKNFWTAIGIKEKIIDILYNTVIPNLSTIDNDELPATLAKHEDELSRKYGNLSKAIKDLRVKCKDGQYRPLSESIFVDCNNPEPFPYISINNQVSFASSDVRIFMHKIYDNNEFRTIDALYLWQQEKIDEYLLHSSTNDYIHFRLFSDLCKIWSNNKLEFSQLKEVTHIKLKTKNGIYINSHKLYMGTLYRPLCDFEANGIVSSEFSYISNDYIMNLSVDEISTIHDFLETVYKVREDFTEDDFKYLSTRTFCVYFWNDYIVNKSIDLDKILDFVEDGLFDHYECIPTVDSVKRPSDLYSRKIDKYVKLLPEYEPLLPLVSIPDINIENDNELLFDKLNFKKKLSFEDAIVAMHQLNPKRKEDKRRLISWMIEQYSQDKAEIINDYRTNPDAIWLNAKNEEKHITELYALDPNDKKINQIIGSDALVISKDYFYNSEIIKACEMLGIPIIYGKDLVNDPKNIVSQDSLKIDFLFRVLIIAGIEDEENLKNRFDVYKSKIEEMHFYACSKIQLYYKNNHNICKSIIDFYQPNENLGTYYYVDSIYSSLVYLDFVKEFSSYLGIKADMDLVKKILNSNSKAESILEDHNELLSNQDFTELHNLYNPEGQIIESPLIEEPEANEEPYNRRMQINIPNKRAHNIQKQKVIESSNINSSIVDNEDIELVDDNEQENDRSAIYSSYKDQLVKNDKNENRAKRLGQEKDNSSVESSNGMDLETFNNWASKASNNNAIQDANLAARNRSSSYKHTDNSPKSQITTETNSYKNDNVLLNQRHEEFVQITHRATDVQSHYRSGCWVNGYYRGDGTYVSGYWRGDCYVSGYDRDGSSYYISRPTYSHVVSHKELDNQSCKGSTCQNANSKSSVISVEPEKKVVDMVTNIKDTTAELVKSDPGNNENIPYSPLVLEEKNATEEELQTINSIVNTIYTKEEIEKNGLLFILRLYRFFVDSGCELERTLEDLLINGLEQKSLKTKSHHKIITCSAKKGILYISPSVWNKLKNDLVSLLVYYGKKSSQFLYINCQEELFDLINKDVIYIQVTGQEKREFINALYSERLANIRGNMYVMVRVVSNADIDDAFNINLSDDIYNTDDTDFTDV